MNVLVLIKKLDQTLLERELRSGGAHGEVITFYNESDDSYCLVINSVEYSDVVQVCIIYKDKNYYAYVQHGESPNVVKLNIAEIENIDVV